MQETRLLATSAQTLAERTLVPGDDARLGETRFKDWLGRLVPQKSSTTELELTLPCLIVGAGPTGLALAAQLHSFGVSFRMIDRSLDRAQESRALGVQARTLELFDSLGLADEMVSRGSTSTRVVIHIEARPVASTTFGEVTSTDTRYPFVLFIAQAETERVLGAHLAAADVTIERGVELVRFDRFEDHVLCVLRKDGAEEQVRAAYLIGCDGAHSTVRGVAGFEFRGGSYPEDFVLGDVEADGPMELGAINSFIGGGGVAMFFPLRFPTTWRVIATAGRGLLDRASLGPGPPQIGPPTLDELQWVVSAPTRGSVVVRDPAWLSHFHLHHRQVAHYRRGRVFLAGDAAHIHSPVGAQGMNTGIQDAWNLGWKLALVLRGTAKEHLLDTYELERWPVGNKLLRYTDRVFSIFTRVISGGRLTSWAREVFAPRLLPRLLGSRRLRAIAFRFVSELGIRYRRSPAVVEGGPRLHGGPRAGDRFPDARVTVDGATTSLQRAVVGPYLTLVLCGDSLAWDEDQLTRIARRYSGLIRIHRVVGRATPRALVVDRAVFASLGAQHGSQYLVRPDGYIAFRCAGTWLEGLDRYLERWYSGALKLD